MIQLRLCFGLLLSLVAISSLGQPIPPGGPPVVITEIMYNPPEVGVDSLEFIELKNPSPDNARNLFGYTFTAGVEYTFPFGVIVEPNEYVIVAIDSVAFENTFGIPAFQWTSGALSNNGETIILENNINGVIDSVVYDNATPWPAEADGGGYSLVFCVDSLDNAVVDDWAAAQSNTGITVNGTAIYANPGTECTITDDVPSLASQHVLVYPNPSNGNFSIRTTANLGSRPMVRLFDLHGKLIYQQQINKHGLSTITTHGVVNRGSYLLTISSETGLYQQPLIILE